MKPMLESNPAENTRQLYQWMQETLEPVSCEVPDKLKHSFKIKLDKCETNADELELDGDDFPYLRSALFDEAVERGAIACVEQ